MAKTFVKVGFLLLITNNETAPPQFESTANQKPGGKILESDWVRNALLY